MNPQHPFELGRWRIEPRHHSIVSEGTTVELRPQVMALLVYLAQRAGRVVSIKEILDELWRPRLVTSASVYTCIRELRQALGDDPREPTFIETIPKEGYRLIAPVKVLAPNSELWRRSLTTSERRSSSQALLVALAVFTLLVSMPRAMLQPTDVADGEPRVAVMAFEVKPAGETTGYLAVGLAEEVWNQLHVMRIPLVGLRSSLASAVSSESPAIVAHVLDASHLIRGFVREITDGLSVRIEIVEPRGETIWSEEYRVTPETTVSLAPIIARHVAGVLEPGPESERTALSPVASFVPKFSAWEHYALALSERRLRPVRGRITAMNHLKSALLQEPEFLRARLLLAETILDSADDAEYFGHYPRAQAIAAARPHLQQVLAAVPESARAHTAMAQLHMLTSRASDRAIARKHLERALTLAPDLAVAHYRLGLFKQGERTAWSEIADHFFRALELDPLWNSPAIGLLKALVHLPSRRHEAGWVLDRMALSDREDSLSLLAQGLWLHAAGELARAAQVLEQALVMAPESSEVRARLSAVLHSLGLHRAAEKGLNVWLGPWAVPLSGDERLREEWIWQLSDDWWSDLAPAAVAQAAYVCLMTRDDPCLERLYRPYDNDAVRFERELGRFAGTVYSPMLSFAEWLKRTGHKDEAASLLQSEWDALDVRFSAPGERASTEARFRARVEALRGNEYAALRHLHHYISSGSLDPRVLMNPVFDAMRQQAAFEQLNAEYEERLARQQAIYDPEGALASRLEKETFMTASQYLGSG